MSNTQNHPNRTKPSRTSRPWSRRLIGFAVAVAAGLAVAACGGYDSEQATEAAAVPSVGGEVSVAETDIGEVLTDPTGLTLYAFLDDVEGVSTCFEACAAAWPPADGDLGVAEGIDAAEFDTTSRPDDTEQLRVGARWPLYTFSGDTVPGDITGQESGGVWFAVGPDGNLIGVDDSGAAQSGDGEQTQPAGGVDTDLGPVMTDADGYTIYVFASDNDGISNCNDACSDIWPPVRSIDDVAPRQDGLTLTTRADGSEHVALDGRPLYAYANDETPGDTNGHRVGGVWFAVSADGQAITPPAVRNEFDNPDDPLYLQSEFWHPSNR